MGNGVWCANGESAVEHTKSKDKAVAAISGSILPLLPHKLTGGMTSTIDSWHYSSNNDNNENTGEDEKTPYVFNHWQSSVGKENDTTAHPCAD